MESFRRNKTEAAETTEFLGLQIDSEFKWKIRTEYVIHKLSSLCVTMRPVMVLMGGGLQFLHSSSEDVSGKLSLNKAI